jgi:DNA-binding beta-propeller fold protein YncE
MTRVLGALALLVSISSFACSDDDPVPSNNNGIPDAGTITSTGTGTALGMLNPCTNSLAWQVWIARQSTNAIEILTGASLQSRFTVDLSATGLVNPHLIAFNEDGTKAVVAMLGTPAANYANGGVLILDAPRTVPYVAPTVQHVVVTERKTHHAVFIDATRVLAANVNAAAEAPGSLTFIDVATGTVTKRLDVGGQAVAIAISPDKSKAYVSNQAIEMDKSRVHVVDLATRELSGDPYLTSKQTVGIAITADGKHLLVTNGMGNNVEKIDLEEPDRSRAVFELASGLPEAHGIALSRDHIIVSARMGQRVVMLDRSGAIAKDLPITATSGNAVVDWLAMAPGCFTAYLTERTDGVLYSININSKALQGTPVPISGGQAMANTHAVAVRPVDDDSM